MLAASLKQRRIAIPDGGWAVVESLLHPMLLLLATPLLAACLGSRGFGLWSLFLAIIAIGGAASVGTATATATVVACCRGEGRPAAIAPAIREGLMTATVGFGLLVLLLAAAGIPLAMRTLDKLGSAPMVGAICALGLLVAWLEHVDQVYAAVWKGFEQFAASARIEIGARLGQFAALLLAAWFETGVLPLIGMYLLATAVRLATRRYRMHGLLADQGVPLRSSIEGGAAPRRSLSGEVQRRALWGWVQGAGGLAFGSVDRILIGAMLGPMAIAQYTVATQLASQFHAITAAATSVLAPRISRVGAGGDPAGAVGRDVVLAMGVNAIVCVVGYSLLLVAAPPVIAAWLGQDLAGSADFLWPLMLAYLLLSLNVVPFHVLSGLGRAGAIAVVCLLGGLLDVLAAWVWVPADGLEGAALARLVYAAVTLLLLPLAWSATQAWRVRR